MDALVRLQTLHSYQIFPPPQQAKSHRIRKKRHFAKFGLTTDGGLWTNMRPILG